MKKGLLIIAGSISTAIGIVGIFIPILPTTPFLLLAAACYVRSSQKFYDGLLSNRVFGAYIKNYLEGKGIPIKLKIITLALLWITIGLSVTFAVQHVAIRIVLMIVAIGVTVHIVLVKISLGKEESIRGDI